MCDAGCEVKMEAHLSNDVMANKRCQNQYAGVASKIA